MQVTTRCHLQTTFQRIQQMCWNRYALLNNIQNMYWTFGDRKMKMFAFLSNANAFQSISFLSKSQLCVIIHLLDNVERLLEIVANLIVVGAIWTVHAEMTDFPKYLFCVNKIKIGKPQSRFKMNIFYIIFYRVLSYFKLVK